MRIHIIAWHWSIDWLYEHIWMIFDCTPYFQSILFRLAAAKQLKLSASYVELLSEINTNRIDGPYRCTAQTPDYFVGTIQKRLAQGQGSKSNSILLSTIPNYHRAVSVSKRRERKVMIVTTFYRMPGILYQLNLNN